MEKEPDQSEPTADEDHLEPPPFDPDPKLASFLERGRKDDPKREWRATQPPAGSR